MTPKADSGSPVNSVQIAQELNAENGHGRSQTSIDKIPLLDSQSQEHVGADSNPSEGIRQRHNG